MLSGNNGIKKKLGTAKEQTEITNEKEIIETSTIQSMGKSKYGDIQETDLKKYLNQNAGDGKTVVKQSNTNFVVTFNDSKRKYLVDSNGNVSIISREGFKVGDYVNYAPDVNNTTYSVLKTYTKYSNQNISQENLDWQILRIYDDGSIDLIGSPTTSKLGIRSDRYSNAVYLINDICKKLYSNNSKNIEARSIKIEDIEYWLSDIGKEKNSSYGKTIAYTGTFYYPDIYQYEIGLNVNSEILDESKIGVSESYVGYNVLYNFKEYWVASRGDIFLIILESASLFIKLEHEFLMGLVLWVEMELEQMASH